MNSLQARELLKNNGIKPSLHRLRILQYLLGAHTHPTVDVIYNDIVEEIPTLSKTTIYNTLKTFIENGVVQAITIEENEVRFDAFMEDHGHFKCTRCGELYDVDLKVANLNFSKIEGHIIEEKQVYFKGSCKSCAAE